MNRIYDVIHGGPLGRLMYSPDRGQAIGVMAFRTHLEARHIRSERPKQNSAWERVFGSRWKQMPDGRWDLTYNLGSGLVTNVGVMAMANDFAWASPSAAAINTLKLANWHATGTGVTAAAITDFKLQTVSTQGGQTPVAGTQSIATSSTGAVPKLQTVATISYTGGEAVTEWGLHTSNTLSATTGTPFTAATATTFTATGTPFTASSTTVQGLQSQIVIPGTTTVYGVIASNSISVGTLINNGTTGWWTQAAGAAGSTPGGTEAYSLRPVMWDHKVFSAINVLNGDSVQFTYTLTINSGG